MESELYNFGTDAIIITRVSTPQQVLNPECSPQLSDLQKYAELYGFTRLKTFGTTESGFLREDSKVGWNLVTDFISKNPTFRTIIVTEISRLGRNDEILMHIKNYLIENKIQLIIKDINFELFNRFGTIDQGKDIIFGLYASMAAAEMRTKLERFKRARKEYRKLGYSIGGKRLFGYERICDGKLGKKNTYIPNPKETDEINTIYNWYLNGIDGDLTITSIARIAYESKARGFSKYLHSRRNVNKCLKESAYIGYKVTHNRIKNPQYWNYKDETAPKYILANSYECSYPQIISDTLFNDVQKKLSTESTHFKVSNNILVDKSRKHTTILAKILRCPVCGNFFIADYRIKDNYIKHTYRCSSAKGKLFRKCNNTQTISMVMLDSATWAFIKEKVEVITSHMNHAKQQIDIESIESEIERLNADIKTFDERIDAENIIFRTTIKSSKNKDKVITEYERNIRKIENERKNLERVIQGKEHSLQIALEASQSKTNIDEIVRANLDKIENDKKEMYKYVHLLIKSVYPIHSDKRYTVLSITSFNNIDEVFDYQYDKTDIPLIKGKKHDNTYYICLDKKDSNRIKGRLITDNLIIFNIETKDFILGESHYSIEDIFNIDLNEGDPTKFHELQRSVEALQYKKLTFYDEDNTVI
ncbi:recombinase family protein [Bacteroides sp. Marseille-P3684]|uniref:recombinase family protein n=1 Tax=Bacteroides sp. Marseille-P3684 TaxID=2086579 RepID=UPI000D0B7BC5|nr:recombinase family protein [Bacteroides sp. Marseille-P3684]